MRTHALRTAMTLYESGTVDLPRAARSAGVSTGRMRRCLRANGVTLREHGPAESAPESGLDTGIW